MSLNQGMGKENVKYLHNGVLIFNYGLSFGSASFRSMRAQTHDCGLWPGTGLSAPVPVGTSIQFPTTQQSVTNAS